MCCRWLCCCCSCCCCAAFACLQLLLLLPSHASPSTQRSLESTPSLSGCTNGPPNISNKTCMIGCPGSVSTSAGEHGWMTAPPFHVGSNAIGPRVELKYLPRPPDCCFISCQVLCTCCFIVCLLESMLPALCSTQHLVCADLQGTQWTRGMLVKSSASNNRAGSGSRHNSRSTTYCAMSLGELQISAANFDAAGVIYNDMCSAACGLWRLFVNLCCLLVPAC